MVEEVKNIWALRNRAKIARSEYLNNLSLFNLKLVENKVIHLINNFLSEQQIHLLNQIEENLKIINELIRKIDETKHEVQRLLQQYMMMVVSFVKLRSFVVEVLEEINKLEGEEVLEKAKDLLSDLVDMIRR